MGSVNLAHALADWLIRAGFPDQDTYEEAVWNKTKDVMQEFVEHMQGDDIILYATACGNAGWQHPDYPNDKPYRNHTVGDKLVCVLMVGALYFMNWGTRQAQATVTDAATNAIIREHLRCAIVHMFSAVLNESVCPSRWGTFYAWYIMGQLGTDGGFDAGLIQQRKCGRNIFSEVQIRELKLNEQVKLWLGKNSKLKEAIQKIKGGALCSTLWQEDWNLQDILGNGTTEDKERSPIVQIVHELQDPMTEIFEEIRKQAEERIEKKAHGQKGNLANDGKNGQAATTAPTPEEAADDVIAEHGVSTLDTVVTNDSVVVEIIITFETFLTFITNCLS
ncbi:hypothetical protein AK88_05046 [Plasmodium fragile]|uniref:Uncharacterized protein n=1 Tax=Plasmodium fragile TaxID=5857 RepID=A0A0D9QEV6_PLAFR|nr:uncharacterized protein AK88_05046 [Plasmodium fragile]KJP85342.1 hypothetical protein AK88_05046 [Plasmodium fragile]